MPDFDRQISAALNNLFYIIIKILNLQDILPIFSIYSKIKILSYRFVAHIRLY